MLPHTNYPRRDYPPVKYSLSNSQRRPARIGAGRKNIGKDELITGVSIAAIPGNSKIFKKIGEGIGKGFRFAGNKIGAGIGVVKNKAGVLYKNAKNVAVAGVQKLKNFGRKFVDDVSGAGRNPLVRGGSESWDALPSNIQESLKILGVPAKNFKRQGNVVSIKIKQSENFATLGDITTFLRKDGVEYVFIDTGKVVNKRLAQILLTKVEAGRTFLGFNVARSRHSDQLRFILSKNLND